MFLVALSSPRFLRGDGEMKRVCLLNSPIENPSRYFYNSLTSCKIECLEFAHLHLGSRQYTGCAYSLTYGNCILQNLMIIKFMNYSKLLLFIVLNRILIRSYKVWVMYYWLIY